MKKLLLLLLITLLVSCEDNNDVTGDCYVSPEPNKICIEIYEPVCACNNLVYGNSYKSDNDILRYTVPINKAKKSLEAFSIAVGEQNEILGINFGWEYIRFKIPITLL